MKIQTIFGTFSPFRFIAVITTYSLGAGLVQYIQHMRSWTDFLLGGLFLLLIILAMDFLTQLVLLNGRFQLPKELKREDVKRLRLVLALSSATMLTAATTIIVGWMFAGTLWVGLVFLIIIIILTEAIYFLTFIRKHLAHLKVICEVFLSVIIPPAFAYFLQYQGLNRYLTMVVVSLVPIYIAFRLLTDLMHFAQDHRLEKPTLVTVMGWQKAMTLHNAFILLTFLLLALIALLGFPWFLLWPVFLTLPIGLLEIWLMERVRRGSKPLWRVMQIATASVFLIPVYLLGFAFWIR